VTVGDDDLVGEELASTVDEAIDLVRQRAEDDQRPDADGDAADGEVVRSFRRDSSRRTRMINLLSD
jgi:hypothetical protein